MVESSQLTVDEVPRPKRAEPAHLPALDGLRGIAILLVLAHQLDLLTQPTRFGYAPSALFALGWVGVQLFFVLSAAF